MVDYPDLLCPPIAYIRKITLHIDNWLQASDPLKRRTLIKNRASPSNTHQAVHRSTIYPYPYPE